MSILSRRFLGRARLFQEMVEDWRTAPNHALFEREVGELIVESKDIAAVAQTARDTIKKRLKERNPEHIDLEGDAMKQALSRIQAAFVHLQEILQIGDRRKLNVPDRESLPDTIAAIGKIGDDIERWFPLPNYQKMDEAIAAVKRGEFITIEELILEAQNDPTFGR